MHGAERKDEIQNIVERLKSIKRLSSPLFGPTMKIDKSHLDRGIFSTDWIQPKSCYKIWLSGIDHLVVTYLCSDCHDIADDMVARRDIA